jgi:hypothetical protein
MNSECILVSTGEREADLINFKGTQGHLDGWKLDAKRVRKCNYVICVADRNDYVMDDLEHGLGFFVGKNLTVRKAILGNESKYIIEFAEYMVISDLPNAYNLWGASKNPVAYKNIEEMEELLQVDFAAMAFKTAPKRCMTYVKEVMNMRLGLEGYETGEDEGLSFTEAKKGLSVRFGVPVDNIEILIRG